MPLPHKREKKFKKWNLFHVYVSMLFIIYLCPWTERFAYIYGRLIKLTAAAEYVAIAAAVQLWS